MKTQAELDAEAAADLEQQMRPKPMTVVQQRILGMTGQYTEVLRQERIARDVEARRARARAQAVEPPAEPDEEEPNAEKEDDCPQV